MTVVLVISFEYSAELGICTQVLYCKSTFSGFAMYLKVKVKCKTGGMLKDKQVFMHSERQSLIVEEEYSL